MDEVEQGADDELGKLGFKSSRAFFLFNKIKSLKKILLINTILSSYSLRLKTRVTPNTGLRLRHVVYINWQQISAILQHLMMIVSVVAACQMPLRVHNHMLLLLLLLRGLLLLHV